MKHLILAITLLLSAQSFALFDDAKDILEGHGAFYYYGDDGVDCHASISIVSVGPLTGSQFDVIYRASQSYVSYGCVEATYNCKAKVDLQTWDVVEDSLSCD